MAKSIGLLPHCFSLPYLGQHLLQIGLRWQMRGLWYPNLNSAIISPYSRLWLGNRGSIWEQQIHNGERYRRSSVVHRVEFPQMHVNETRTYISLSSSYPTQAHQ